VFIEGEKSLLKRNSRNIIRSRK